MRFDNQRSSHQARLPPNVRERGLGVDDPKAFFDRAGVGLSDGAVFGAPGFVRLNFGCPRATLQQALDRMAAALINPG